MTTDKKLRFRQLLKTIGPGIIFASSAIGTSHLVLSTRAGAHHGMIYFWIILAALLFKYPFFEFGPRYANATGYSIMKGYKDQGKWAIIVFMAMIFMSMFAVAGAVGAVCAGLLSTMFGVQFLSVPILAAIIIALSIGILLFGGYKGLDSLIKIISVVLLVTSLTAFIAVLMKGPIPVAEGFKAPPILEGAGLTLLISLIGWMPTGLEASTMNSIWNIEKVKATSYTPNLKEVLFDFNLGYLFTIITAIMFLVIGAFTVFGSGELLDGSTTAFSNKLLKIFTGNLGQWSYYVIAIAAFGTIYGTLIAVLDAFPRCFVHGMRALKFQTIEHNAEQTAFLDRNYKIWVILVGLGGFSLFFFSSSSMIRLLEFATILSFLISPIIGILNLRAVQAEQFPASHRPNKVLIWLSYVGLILMIGFAVYYLVHLSIHGVSH